VDTLAIEAEVATIEFDKIEKQTTEIRIAMLLKTSRNMVNYNEEMVLLKKAGCSCPLKILVLPAALS
jgi:hypothetical protein